MTNTNKMQITDQKRNAAAPRVRSLGQLTPAQVRDAVANGARFVVYEYCISLVAASLRGRSVVWFRKPGQGRRWPGVPYTLLSLVLGWWGIPWGFIYTPLAIFTNLRGGLDVTEEVLPRLSESSA
jgi:hypothetical protein